MGCPRCGSAHVSASGRCGNCGALDASSVTVLTPAVAVPSPLSSSAETSLADPLAETALADSISKTSRRGQTPQLAIGPLVAGQTFGTRYHIIRPLGAGGMG